MSISTLLQWICSDYLAQFVNFDIATREPLRLPGTICRFRHYYLITYGHNRRRVVVLVCSGGGCPPPAAPPAMLRASASGNYYSSMVCTRFRLGFFGFFLVFFGFFFIILCPLPVPGIRYPAGSYPSGTDTGRKLRTERYLQLLERNKK